MAIANLTPEEAERLLAEQRATGANTYQQNPRKEAKKGLAYIDPEAADMHAAGLLKDRESQFEPQPVKWKVPTSGIREEVAKYLTADGHLWVRPMRAADEGLLLDQITQNKNISELMRAITLMLDRVMKSSVSVEHLFSEDMISMLRFVIAISYESSLEITEFVANCELCSKKDKELKGGPVRLDLNLMKAKELPKDTDYPFTHQPRSSFPDMDMTIVFEAPLVAMGREILERAKFMEAISRLIVRIEGSLPSGREIQEKDYSDILNNLNIHDQSMMFKKIQEFSELMGEQSTAICNRKGSPVSCDRGKGCPMNQKTVEWDNGLLIYRMLDIVVKNRV